MLQHNYYKLLNPAITILLTVKVKKQQQEQQQAIRNNHHNKWQSTIEKLR